MEQAMELAVALEHRPTGWLEGLADYYRLMRLRPLTDAQTDGRTATLRGVRHSRDRDRQAVSFHYDVSNSFYRLWLDTRMIYSCAYFTDGRNDLGSAQVAKLDHLCRKLRLRPGQQILDIGCGRGGLAIYAAQQYRMHVTGVTLSAHGSGRGACEGGERQRPRED